MATRIRIEWITLGLIALCYAGWMASLWLATVSVPLAIMAAALTIALQSSLQHEVLHGHPTPWQPLNAALVFASLNLAVPYCRFRDTHLAHHMDERLTDPYEDPESNFLDPVRWHRMPDPIRVLYRLNNTLAGRIILGPLIGQVGFMSQDARAIAQGNRKIAIGWLVHITLASVLLLIVASTPMPIWAYAIAAWAGLGIVRIRTFLEHRAHHQARARTVIVEDRGPLAFLFLNNNLHVVHHMHPRVPWYELPALYAGNAAHYLRRNEGYRYASYGQIFREHLLRAKDPVPHPLWSQTEAHAMNPHEPLDSCHPVCEPCANAALYVAASDQGERP